MSEQEIRSMIEHFAMLMKPDDRDKSGRPTSTSRASISSRVSSPETCLPLRGRTPGLGGPTPDPRELAAYTPDNMAKEWLQFLNLLRQGEKKAEEDEEEEEALTSNLRRKVKTVRIWKGDRLGNSSLSDDSDSGGDSESGHDEFAAELLGSKVQLMEVGETDGTEAWNGRADTPSDPRPNSRLDQDQSEEGGEGGEGRPRVRRSKSQKKRLEGTDAESGDGKDGKKHPEMLVFDKHGKLFNTIGGHIAGCIVYRNDIVAMVDARLQVREQQLAQEKVAFVQILAERAKAKQDALLKTQNKQEQRLKKKQEKETRERKKRKTLKRQKKEAAAAEAAAAEVAAAEAAASLAAAQEAAAIAAEEAAAAAAAAAATIAALEAETEAETIDAAGNPSRPSSARTAGSADRRFSTPYGEGAIIGADDFAVNAYNLSVFERDLSFLKDTEFLEKEKSELAENVKSVMKGLKVPKTGAKFYNPEWGPVADPITVTPSSATTTSSKASSPKKVKKKSKKAAK